MARRQRDYKAEYAARKAKASGLGYSSVRQYKRSRKQIISGGGASQYKGIRDANAEWSKEHSRQANSKWNPLFSDSRALGYYSAFITYSGKERKAQRMHVLHDYLINNGLITEDEWLQNYVRNSD